MSNPSEEEWQRFQRIRSLDTEGYTPPHVLPTRQRYAGSRVTVRIPPSQTDLDSPEVKCLGTSFRGPSFRARRLFPISRTSETARTPSIYTIFDPRSSQFSLAPPLDQPFNVNYPSQQPSNISNLNQQLSDLNVSDLMDRPRHMPRQRPSIPYFARQTPIPETPIVSQYRDPQTGGPSFDRLRQQRPWVFKPETSGEMGASLANLSRYQIKHGVVSHDQGRQARKMSLLKMRGFRRVGERYVPYGLPETRTILNRPRFVAQTDRDREDLYMPRFNRPLHEQDRPLRSRTTEGISQPPVGRQQWGPLRRAYSMPDLSDPGLVQDMDELSPMAQFEERFGKLRSADRRSYRSFQDQVSLSSNPLARSRMVKPPTYGNIGDSDKRRLSEMKNRRAKLMGYRITPQNADRLRKARRDYVTQRAYQDFSIPSERRGSEVKPFSEWMAQTVRQTIPESNRRISEDDVSENESDNEADDTFYSAKDWEEE